MSARQVPRKHAIELASRVIDVETNVAVCIS